MFVLLQMIPQPTTVIPFYASLAAQHLINSLAGLIIADSALLLPLAVLLLRPFFLDVPKELEDAACIDGASLRVVLYRVVVPLVRNGLVTVGVVVFAITWGEFIYAATFLNKQGLFPISVILLNQVGNYLINWNELMAISVIACLPILVLFLASQRRLREGLLLGSIR